MRKFKGFTLIELMTHGVYIIAIIGILASAFTEVTQATEQAELKEACQAKGGQWSVIEYESDGDKTYSCVMPEVNPAPKPVPKVKVMSPAQKEYAVWREALADCPSGMTQYMTYSDNGTRTLMNSEKELIDYTLEVCNNSIYVEEPVIEYDQQKTPSTSTDDIFKSY